MGVFRSEDSMVCDSDRMASNSTLASLFNCFKHIILLVVDSSPFIKTRPISLAEGYDILKTLGGPYPPLSSIKMGIHYEMEGHWFDCKESEYQSGVLALSRNVALQVAATEFLGLQLQLAQNCAGYRLQHVYDLETVMSPEELTDLHQLNNFYLLSYTKTGEGKHGLLWTHEQVIDLLPMICPWSEEPDSPGSGSTGGCSHRDDGPLINDINGWKEKISNGSLM